MLGAAGRLRSRSGQWKIKQDLSFHWGPGRYWDPLPSLWKLSALVTGRPYPAQSFVSDSIVRGRLRGKKGTSPRDRKARWHKKVWLCGLKRAGMDQRTGCWPAAFVRQTALASFNLSQEVGKAHGISSYTEAVPYGDISVPLLQPLHLGQYRRWKWMGGVGLCIVPTCQGSTTKGAEPSLSGCPAAISYVTIQHSHGLAASLAWLHWESHRVEGIKIERISQSLTCGR